MPKTKLTPFLLLVSCGVALCTLNATAAVAQELPSLPQPIEETVVAQPALLDQLRAGTMTAEEAWDKKLLDEKSALALLEGGIASWREEDPDQRLRVALVSVLMKHAPQQLEVTAKTSLRLKRALADYYASLDDERAVALYEGLATRDEYSSYEKAVLLETLGKWQGGRGQAQAAITTFLRAREWFAKAGQQEGAASMIIEAARVYFSAGEESKAQELYAKVPSYGIALSSAIASYDRARILIGQGKHQAARQLLNVPGDAVSDQMQMAYAALLSQSYYFTGEMQQALECSTSAMRFYEKIKTPEASHVDLASAYMIAKRISFLSRNYLKVK